jgi:multidrug efflux pump subunit AcrB
LNAVLRFLVERTLVVNLVSIFLMVMGTYAMLNINREAFPNVNLDKVQIDSVYPGSTPTEIERLVITPIEQELKSLDGIDKMTSIAFPGSGRIILELEQDASNRDRIVSDVQLAVDRANLPTDLQEEPTVLEIDGQMIPILNIAISSPRSEVELKRLGDRIEDDLLAIEGVGRIQVQGDRRAEIRVVVDPVKLQQQRIPVGDLARLLATWNVNAPGGELDTPEGQKGVRVVGQYQTPDDVKSLVIRANERGEGITVADVATVTESLEEAQVYFDVSGIPALNIIVMKKASADIINLVDRIKAYLETVPQRYGDDIEIATHQDFSQVTRLRLGVLSNNGLVGLVLVFISLLMFLRPSVALTTTWGLPIVFFTGLYVLYISGITLNLVSMMGFIMVLGMLVDDAIIIGENITYHMEQGMKPNEAAVVGARELMGPVTTTVMTTVAAFLPLMFMSGIIGKFIVAIPIVVISLLIFSWLESFLILPSHVAHVTNPHQHPGEKAWLIWLENLYGKFLELALKLRWLTLLVAFLALVGSFYVAATRMSFQLFPAAGIDQFIVRITTPPGITLEDMRDRLRDLDKSIRERVDPKYLEATLISTGQIAQDSGDPLTQRGSRFGQIRVIYYPAVTRPEHNVMVDMKRIARDIIPLYPEFKLAFDEQKHGPPTGRALQVEISSNDNEANERASDQLVQYLMNIKGVTTVESGLEAGDAELRVVMDRALAAYAGVDLETAAAHIRAAVGGLRVSTTRIGTEEVDVTIRYPADGNDQVQQLLKLRLPNQAGGMVPLERIARLEEKPGYTTIRHKAGIRVVNVVANINVDDITSLELNRLVMAKEAEWIGDMAGRVSVHYGGEEEKNQESFVDLKNSFIFALVAIFFILAIQFNNLTYPIIVMLAIPFGAIGIIISFYLHDLLWKPMPLSFFSTLGMVALTGVVVNSSLVLLVFIQRSIKQGMNCREAILLAGRRRLRAVILTATTTVLGLLPTAYGWGGSDPFVAPMALALSWGLFFATVITLLVIPAALAVTLDMQERIGRVTLPLRSWVGRKLRRISGWQD